MDDTKNTFVEIMEALNKRMEQFEDELKKSPPASGTSSTIADDYGAFKSLTAQLMRGFQQQLGLLAQSVDNIEMHSRRKILLLHGVPEEKSESIPQLVVRIVTDQMKLARFSCQSISRCQRIGRVSTDKPRPILVKFADIDVRNKIWSSKTSLKGSKVTLSEFLTKSRHVAFMQARQRFGIKNCWTRDGFIHIIAPDGQRHRICGISELQKIASVDTLKVPPPAASKKQAAAAAGPAAASTTRTTRKAK